MTVAKRIRNEISCFPNNFIFTASDLIDKTSERGATSRTLQRMAREGMISKFSRGKYYKPHLSIFGELKPSSLQIAQEFLIKRNKVIGYLTGGYAFSKFGLSTQISSIIEIGTNQYRRPIKGSNFEIQFILQKNDIKEDNIEALRILDCLRFIKKIPDTTTDEACRIIIDIISRLSFDKKHLLIALALNYPPYVRALLGAILEAIGMNIVKLLPLQDSLSGVSKYRLSISPETLPTKTSWKIYETSRK